MLGDRDAFLLFILVSSLDFMRFALKLALGGLKVL